MNMMMMMMMMMTYFPFLNTEIFMKKTPLTVNVNFVFFIR